MLHVARVWIIALTGSACAFVGAMPVEGQRGPCSEPDCLYADARELAAGLRAEVEQGRMREVFVTLIQFFRPYPPHELDALADSVVEITVDLVTRGAPEANRIREMTASIFHTAAVWRPQANAPAGVAYDGATQRLVELAYRLPGGDVYLLYRVRPIIGDEQWLAHLRYFATSDLPAASAAVYALDRRAGPAGDALLCELHEAGLIIQSMARFHLERYGSCSPG